MLSRKFFASVLVVALFFSILSAQFAGAATSDLFISEYVEGSSSITVEIYNGTGSAVDLTGYVLELYSNGSATVSQSIDLSGVAFLWRMGTSWCWLIQALMRRF